jgi:hypothetical protein
VTEKELDSDRDDREFLLETSIRPSWIVTAVIAEEQAKIPKRQATKEHNNTQLNSRSQIIKDKSLQSIGNGYMLLVIFRYPGIAIWWWTLRKICTAQSQ